MNGGLVRRQRQHECDAAADDADRPVVVAMKAVVDHRLELQERSVARVPGGVIVVDEDQHSPAKALVRLRTSGAAPRRTSSLSRQRCASHRRCRNW